MRSTLAAGRVTGGLHWEERKECRAEDTRTILRRFLAHTDRVHHFAIELDGEKDRVEGCMDSG